MEVKDRKKKEYFRIKHVRYKDVDKLTKYETYRVWLAVVQIIATLGVPFVVIALNEYRKIRG